MKLYKIILFLILPLGGFSQTLSLMDLLKYAKDNNPMINLNEDLSKMKDEINKQTKIKSYPKINLEGLASLQSENLSLDFPFPNAPKIELPIYKANLYLKADYAIFDGGVNEILGNLKKLDLELQNKQNEVNLYQIHQSVADLFYGILLLRGKRKILKETIKDIEVKQDFLKKGVKHGVANSLGVTRLDFQLAKLTGQIEQTHADEQTLIAVLSELTGKSIDENINLVNDIRPKSSNATRPEIDILNTKSKNIAAKKDLIDAAKRPKVFTFAQLGLGYPNPINLFDDTISPYGILGVKAVWNIYDFKYSDTQKEVVKIQQDIIEKQKEAFNQKIQLNDLKINQKIASIKLSIQNDKDVLKIQDLIIEKVGKQLKLGTAKTVDYISEVDKKTQLELAIELKEIQISKLKINQVISNGI